MKWKTLRWWLFGALTYLLFLLAQLPAQFVTGWLGRHAPGVQLDGVSGNVFSGHANGLRVQGAMLGSLKWRFDWLALLSASYGYRFQLMGDGEEIGGRIDLRGSRVFLFDLEGHIPVATVERWLPLPSHSVSGSLGLRFKELDVKGGHLTSADGEVELDDGVLSWPRSYTLGSFHATLSPAVTGGIDAEASDVASPLKLHATLNLSVEGVYHLSGAVGPKDPLDSVTRSLLAGFGAPDSTGQYPFDFKGQW